MSEQGLMEQGKAAEHNTTHRGLLPSYGWTDVWFTRVFLLSLPVQESQQEAEALRHFAEWERSKGGQPQNI